MPRTWGRKVKIIHHRFIQMITLPIVSRHRCKQQQIFRLHLRGLHHSSHHHHQHPSNGNHDQTSYESATTDNSIPAAICWNPHRHCPARNVPFFFLSSPLDLWVIGAHSGAQAKGNGNSWAKTSFEKTITNAPTWKGAPCSHPPSSFLRAIAINILHVRLLYLYQTLVHWIISFVIIIRNLLLNKKLKN